MFLLMNFYTKILAWAATLTIFLEAKKTGR